ncbi:MAG: Omp28 family outer membrane lipoprotein [Bacteroidales bacterium]|jgi:hypothetical protein|nr:Omp28 family outer membrane lipoprotein [Bacteroidales bacterium]
MKGRNLKYLAVLLLAASAFVWLGSCDKIEQPYTGKIEGPVDTATCPVPDFPAVTLLKKRVLLEDYTGHKCVNCPAAALIAHNLKEIHGDQLVVLAVHAGFFAAPSASGTYANDYRTEAGTAWDAFFGIGQVGNPNGMVNRTGYPLNHIMSPASWSAQIGNALATDPLVDLQMINEYDATERKLCTHIKTRFVSSLDRNLKLIVVLAESGIISAQKNNDAAAGDVPEIPEYEHNHMLRAAITSPWGNQVAVKGVTNPESVVKSFKYILPEKFNAANCTAIAFVYDDDTEEVLQAVEAPVVE